MRIFVNKLGVPSKARLVLRPNSSFGMAAPDLGVDYEIGLDDFGKLALDFNFSTGKCISVEGYSTDKFASFRECDLAIDAATDCDLRMVPSDDDPTEFGMTFKIPLEGRFIDLKRKRIRFGTPSVSSIAYRFGEGQYIYFNGGDIEAILIEFYIVEGAFPAGRRG